MVRLGQDHRVSPRLRRVGRVGGAGPRAPGGGAAGPGRGFPSRPRLRCFTEVQGVDAPWAGSRVRAKEGAPAR